ncbi:MULTISPECIES: hypothetical protein [Ramlibacter]|uniref:DUF2946 domain-containing protein n=1 Tax=Ramlibacter aquaticus TaxID=2780094 RepID=A0ABR9SH88_9BURK|nr:MULTISPECIES: hypothetical protein [Ramlibacter]MBE7941728.1 hypothetical protein [Ramlibacter aquaticus]
MTSRKRLAWLLWFALLLPFAQLAAAAHELGHLAQPAAATKAKAQAVTCEVCLAAAALGSGGAAATPPALALAPLPHALPDFQPGPTAAPRFDAVFRSRAPPSA